MNDTPPVRFQLGQSQRDFPVYPTDNSLSPTPFDECKNPLMPED